MRVEMDLRNIPLLRLQEYLIEAGGELVGDRFAKGDQWTATLKEMEPIQLGVMKIYRDLLIIEGDEKQVETVYALLRQRTMRGGG